MQEIQHGEYVIYQNVCFPMNMHTPSLTYQTDKVQGRNLVPSQMQQDGHSQKMECVDNAAYDHQTKLVKELALFRFIFMKERLLQVQQLVRTLILGIQNIGEQYQISKQQLHRYFIDQSQIMSEQIAEKCQKSLLFVLKAKQIMFRKNNEKKTIQKDTIKIQERPFSHLLEILKFNHVYSEICKWQSDFIPLGQIALIFDCDVSLIEHFKEIYLKNQTRISMDHGCPEKVLINMLIVVKIKATISRGLMNTSFPAQKLIEEELLKIVIFYMQQDQILSQSRQPKISLARLCAKQNNLCDLKLGLRKHIIGKVKEIMQDSDNKQQQEQQIERICEQYRLKKRTLLGQMKKIRKNEKLSTQQIDDKSRQIMAEIKYARYTSHNDSLRSMLGTFYKKFGKTLHRVQDTVANSCQQEIREMKQCEEKNLSAILQRILRLIMETQQVAFIGFEIFYKQQFKDYNILSNRADLVTTYTPFAPAEDVIFFLVTGITNKRIIFHSLIMENLTAVTYLSYLKAIFDKTQKSLPKMLALFIPIRLEGIQWEKLSAFTSYAESRGFLVFLVPTFQRIPNVNRFISDILKSRLLAQFSLLFSEEKLKSFKKILQSSIIEFFSSAYSRRRIEKFMSDNWRN